MNLKVSWGRTVLFLLMMGASSFSLPAFSPATGLPESDGLRYFPVLNLPLADIKTAVSGRDFSCVLTNGGAVRCWGDNTWGQLGDGTTTDRSLPVPVVGLDSGVTAIAAGNYHACAVTASGRVTCWGKSGALGNGSNIDSATPVAVTGLTTGVRNISTGGNFSCAQKTDGSVLCWGVNGYGELGDGTNISKNAPVAVSGLAGPVTSLEAGGMHVCAVLTNGGVQCWGLNRNGQLGDGTTTNRYNPVTVSGLSGGAVSLGAGFEHSCAVLNGGGLQCWGENNGGQLGDGTTTDRYTPVSVSALSAGVASVSGGFNHSCAVTAANGVQCWGRNFFGQLGNGSTTDSLAPAAVTGLGQGVKTVAAGEFHTVAVTVGGAGKAWGYNTHGQLGNGATIWVNLPLDVSGLPVDIMTTATGYAHTCALLSGGAVRCWGSNSSGQLGDGTEVESHLPVPVVGLDSGVGGIAAGSSHNCVVTTGGGVKCWGWNPYGQLGDGTKTLRRAPVDVPGLSSGVRALSAGNSHTCALNAGGEVFCWGKNDQGQLGVGSSYPDSTAPVKVTGLSGVVTSITAGTWHTCALLNSGGVQCWGDNGLGQLGNGTGIDSAVPVPVNGLSTGIISLSGKDAHTCAVTAGGAVKCWGYNWYGQLGNGTSTNSNTPVNVIGLNNGFKTVSTGYKHTCARTDIGAMKCWGEDQEGELGDGANTRRNTPVDVSGLAGGVSSLDAGGGHTCAALDTKRLKCWGWNGSGQLGLGTLDKSLTPINVLASVDPLLTSNYVKGPPGSFFTLTGQHFPPGSLATVIVNGTVLTSNLAINETGGFILFMDTAGADPGYYQVNVSVNPNASSGKIAQPGKSLSSTNAVASFILDPQSPLNLLEGGGLVLSVPDGIGGYKMYLPLILRN